MVRMTMSAKMFVLAALFPHLTEAVLGKSTYAMSHPFAYKAWMEKFLPTKENIVQKNSTKTCNEWVKLCIDDGSNTECSGPMGNTQIHSVGAYLRDSGDKSMQEIEYQFTQTLAGMAAYDPMMELHAGFYTTDLDSYINKFKAADTPFLATKFESANKIYDSIIVQVDGSLAPGAKSLLVLELIGKSSVQREAVFFSTPRASAASLRRASEERAASNALTLLHVSFPSSNITRDMVYFENVRCVFVNYRNICSLFVILLFASRDSVSQVSKRISKIRLQGTCWNQSGNVQQKRYYRIQRDPFRRRRGRSSFCAVQSTNSWRRNRCPMGGLPPPATREMHPLAQPKE